jgi:hypothetical protein
MQDYQQNATVKSHVEVVITRRQLCRWSGEEFLIRRLARGSNEEDQRMLLKRKGEQQG